MQRIRDRIGTHTYASQGSGVTPWFNWYYDPVSLRARTGWFHIIFVQNKHSTQTYLAAFEEEINCNFETTDYEGWRECQMHYDYTGHMSLDNVEEWGIGNRGQYLQEMSEKSVVHAHNRFEDFSVYRWPLNVDEVTLLHQYKNQNRSGVRPSSSRPVNNENLVATEELISLPSLFKVYPNPSDTGNFMVQFNLNIESTINYELINLNGQVISKGVSQKFGVGNSQYPINFAGKITRGVYMLRLRSNEFTEIQKVIIH